MTDQSTTLVGDDDGQRGYNDNVVVVTSIDSDGLLSDVNHFVKNDRKEVPCKKSLRQVLQLDAQSSGSQEEQIAIDSHTVGLSQQQQPGSTAASSSPKRKRPYIVGHRGAPYKELENTIPSFRVCRETCDAVELDVFLLPKDNTLVVFHGSGTDENPGKLEDYCGVGGGILDLTLEEARNLTFNPSNEEFVCGSERVLLGRIPTLEEVLLDIRDSFPRMHTKIELKGPGTAQPVLELVERLGMVDYCSYSSFEHSRIEEVRKLRPQRGANDDDHYLYPTGAIYDGIPSANFVERALAIGASEIHLRYDTCTVDRIKAIHDAGMGSMAWMRGPLGMRYDTTNKYLDVGNEDETFYATLWETGVEKLCVNRPDVLYRMCLSE